MPNMLVEPKILDLADPTFSREVVPGAAYMKHAFGNDMSIALFKIERGKGSTFPRQPHSHGEEVAIQLKGSSVLLANGKEYEIGEGQMIIVPGGLEHAGFFTDEEESLLLAICTPRREDYGEPTWQGSASRGRQ